MSKNLKLLFALLIVATLIFSCKSDNNNEQLVQGFSLTQLEEAKTWADENTQTAAVIVMVNGEVVYEWGNLDEKYLTHSCRKSFMSALYGKYILDGTIDINATMADLGIDDEPPLTEQEKTATVKHCLQACSGVFHTAEAETDGMHNLKPERDSCLPGTFWLYNNWDFNVLRTIFENETGQNFYEALKNDIFDPIGANFELEDAYEWEPTRSIHPAYMFSISARDMALFGQLILQNGNWNGTQVIDSAWITESTQYYWDAELYRGDGYSYMWWVATNENAHPYLPNCEVPAGTFSARGAGGHFLEIIPEYNMIFVHRVNTWERHRVSSSDIGTILQMILDAKQE